MTGRAVRVGCAALALSSAVIGVWAAFFPHAFYAHFPGGGHAWVAVDGPVNEHLVRDVGQLNLGFALLLGQSKRGFPASFAACAYGVAPMVLLAIPGCGGVLALVWTIVLTGVGLKETHQIKSGGAAATVVAPYLLIMTAS